MKVSINKNHSYLNFIAYLQIIGIILVVFGHSFHEFPDGQYGSSMFIYRFCHNFRMPLFLFVSGFLLSYTTEITNTKHTPSSFISNKLKRLVLPMVVLTAITFVPRVYMSFAADDAMEFNLNNFLRSFIDHRYMPIPYFWFIHVSFILLISCFLLINLCKRLGISALTTLITIFILLLIYALSSLPTTTLFSIHQLKQLGFFLILGAIYGLTFNKIDKWIPWTNWLFFIFSFGLCLYSFISLEGTIFAYISSLFGIIMTLSIAKIIEKNNGHFLDHLKGANYIIFLLSWYCNVFFQQALAHFISLPWWIHSFLSLVAGIYIPWLVYKYLEQHQESKWIRFVSFLLGQRFKQKTIFSTNTAIANN